MESKRCLVVFAAVLIATAFAVPAAAQWLS
jgi:hypothetical protein